MNPSTLTPGTPAARTAVPGTPSITTQYLARYRRAVGSAADPDGPLPVTGAQRRFVLARRLAPGGRPDVVPLFFAFPAGTVDLDRLRRAAGHLAARHPALRARTEVLRAAPVQRLCAAEALVERAAARPGESAADALRRELARWAPEGPPLRLFLADASKDRAPDDPRTDRDEPVELLALALDHAVCDEQSLGRITADLTDAYRAGLGPADVPQDLAAEEAQGYRDAVHLQLAAEERASAPRSLAYWARRLASVRTEAPRPPHPSRLATAGATEPAWSADPAFPTHPAGAARAVLPVAAGDSRAAAFPVLLGAAATAARALYGPGPVPLFAYPWGGRPAAAPPVLGCFLNTVVHPALDGGPDEVTTRWWDDLDHADTPFDEVVHAARAASSPWSGKLDGMLTFEDLHRRPPLALGGVEGREVHVEGRPLRVPFAISVSYGSELLVRAAWDRSAFSDAHAEEAFAALVGELHARTGAMAPAL
ncbi:non-ribosomal peptide synthetase [Streptomyces sp. NPDC050504]|uniref:non-ribosomal peptide synthetase n=1 Tax=Streptomyces sp. NPDC050504 TaxID=3365618 RepID=UPI0037872A68